MADYRLMSCRGFGLMFLFYFLTLTPSVNGFAEHPAILHGLYSFVMSVFILSELGLNIYTI